MVESPGFAALRGDTHAHRSLVNVYDKNGNEVGQRPARDWRRGHRASPVAEHPKGRFCSLGSEAGDVYIVHPVVFEVAARSNCQR